MPTTTLNKKDSVIISYLKAMAIFLVILGHCFSYYSRTHELSAALDLMVKLIYHVHVPTFFVIAGFLCHKQKVSAFYKKKLIRLLIPFWFFAFLKLLYSNLISSEFVHADSLFQQIYDAYILGSVYWFAYGICAVFLTAPLFWENMDQKHPKKALVGLIVSIIFNILYDGFQGSFLPDVFQIKKALFHLPFFLSGYVIRFYYDPIRKWLLKTWKLMLMLSFAVIVGISILHLMHVSVNTFAIQYIAAFALMGFMVWLSAVLPESVKLLHSAGDYSWQLMLLDSFYKAILFNVAMRIFSVSTVVVLIIAVSDFFLGIFTCLISKRIPVLRNLMGLSRESDTLGSLTLSR